MAEAHIYNASAPCARWRFVAFLAAIMLLPALAQAQDDDSLSLISELLREPDKDIRALALEQVRTQAPGEAATLKFAEILPTLPQDAQVGMLSALAARGDAAATPAVRKLLKDSPDESVRVAALEALGRLGDETDVGTLVAQLAAGDAALQKAARGSLIRLTGPQASAAIIGQMQRAAPGERVALIEVLTERRTGEQQLLAAALDSNSDVRRAAMNALGKFATPEHLAALVQGVLKAEPGSERAAAERAVALVCQRIEEPDRQAQALLAVMDQLNAQDRLALMPTLGRVGGPAALAAAEQAYNDKDASVHAAGLAALCNWPDGAVAARLLEIARVGEHPDHRTLARRALLRIAPLEDARSDARRLDLLRTLAVMCTNDAERNQLLDRAKAVRTVETLRFVLPYLDQPALSEQACLTVVELAHHSGLREQHKDEFHQALDKVIATSQDATVIDRAQRYKVGRTWVRPKPAS
jgi:HEAT repeat protein